MNSTLILIVFIVILVLLGLFLWNKPQINTFNFNFDGLTPQQAVNLIVDFDRNKQLKQFKESADYFILGTISQDGYPSNRWMEAFFNDGKDNFTFVTPKNSGKVKELTANNKASAFFSFELIPNNYTDISFFGQPTVIEDRGDDLVYSFNPVSVAVYHRSVDNTVVTSSTYQVKDNQLVKVSQYNTTKQNNKPNHPFDKN